MTSWREKAKAHFAHSRHETAPKTTETQLMGVLVAPPLPVLKNCACSDAAEQALLQELLAEADHACNYWGDDAAAREQMRLEVMALAKNQWHDLLAHFCNEYRR